MRLKEALEASRHDAVLLHTGTNDWTVLNLLDALSNEDLARPVFSCAEHLAVRNEQSYHLILHLSTIVPLSKTPYVVSQDSKRYHVQLRRREKPPRSRSIDGHSCSVHKQAAHRRKNALNKQWQQLRVLGA